MSGLYEDLCNLFIKPARQTYSDHDLGPYTFGQYGIRQNFSFSSHKGFEIKTTFFKNKNINSNTCIIYLHSFNGSRLQSLRYASEIMQKDFHFCSFDFAGCGNSGGEYVSLGCNQRWDVLKLIESLKLRYGLTQFFIWGRSMGAVAAVKFYSLLAQEQADGRFTDISILGLVLDSAFISLKRMVVEVGQSRISVPQILIKAIFSIVSSSIQQKAGFKFEDLELEADIQSIRCSTLLVTSKQDTFVNYSHSQDIFGKLKLHDNKQIEYTKGEHYQTREQKTVNNIYAFIEKKYKKYNELVQKMTHLKQSRTNGIHIQEFSLEKHTKSLRKYEPKVGTSQKRPEQLKLINENEKKFHGSSKIVLFRSNAQDKQPKYLQSTQFKTGSDKKIPFKSCQFPDKQYQTQKKIQQPHIKIVIASKKETKHKNELRNKSKPNFICRIDEVCNNRKIEQDLEQQLNKSTERTLQVTENQQNHCNIITDKLRKKGKMQREKVVQLKDKNEVDQIDNTKYSQKPKTKINFTIGNIVGTPISLHDNEKSTKKLSMTAQQYKNSQIKLIKGVVTLSPNIKKRAEKASCTDLKLKPGYELKCFQQSKSMNNLITLGGNHDRPETRSYKNMSSMLNCEFNLPKKD